MMRHLLPVICLAMFAVPVWADEKPNPAATPAMKDEKRHEGFLEEIKKQHPEAKVLLLGIFPRSAKPTDAVRDKIKKTNELLEKFAGGNVKYKDIGKAFLAEGGILTGEIMPDFLHLSPKGYQIWADSIKGDLEEMTK